jgi:histidinol phosphatase-like enzyme
LLYRRAAADHGLDLARSWWVGDRERDVVPAERFGGRCVLIGQPPAVVRDLSAAVDIILNELQ